MKAATAEMAGGDIVTADTGGLVRYIGRSLTTTCTSTPCGATATTTRSGAMAMTTFTPAFSHLTATTTSLATNRNTPALARPAPHQCRPQRLRRLPQSTN